MEEGEQIETIEWARQDSPASGGEGRGAPVLRREGAGLGDREQRGGGGDRRGGEVITPRGKTSFGSAY